MTYDELQRLVGYGLTVIEFYNEDGLLEYALDLNDFNFEDVDIVLSTTHEPYGIIKLKAKDEPTEYND